ncbi:hypothetical protein CROQUDRAFT_53509, partial [Cronartium quercuum f. sp. fusiforme G11]
MDKSLRFKDGDDIDRFIQDFEDAAFIDGASDLDKCIQFKFFIPDKDTKTVIESMEGYKVKRWVILKNEMKQLWGAGLEALYTLEDIFSLCKKMQTEGGISAYAAYCRFQSKFKTMVTYVKSTGQI